MPVPAPVRFDVNDADVAFMWKAVQRQRHGVAHPAFFVLGVLFVLFNLVPIVRHGGVNWGTLALGLAYIGLSFFSSARVVGALRPTDLRFSDDGLDFDVAFAPPSNRYYPWRLIHRIDDIGDSFMIVTSLRKRIVMPKRSFPDGGDEALAFIAAHGVAVRKPQLQTASA
jgi:hypothetical protein